MKHSFKDLIVWQKSVELVVEIYEITKSFPEEELYNLTSQMRRAAVSIPSNIAEGKLRGSQKECRQFFFIAFGSGAELETQVEIAKKLYNGRIDFEKSITLLSEVMKMLNKLISKYSRT